MGPDPDYVVLVGEKREKREVFQKSEGLLGSRDASIRSVNGVDGPGREGTGEQGTHSSHVTR